MLLAHVMDETLSLPAPIAAVANPDLSELQLVKLARELVMHIQDPAKVIAAFNITQVQFDQHVITNRFYKRAYETLLIEWEAAATTNKRIAFKSAFTLEDGLPKLGARMVDDKENLNAAVETAKLLAKLSGAGEQKADTTPGEKFTIQINIGAKELKYEETVGPPEIQLIPEGPSPERTLSSGSKTN